jgi:dihydrofolate synthase/folylpolyglutamate synthase
MNLQDGLDWLYSTQLFGIKLGLEGTKRLLEALHCLPQPGVKVVHVAGTNGKGSTCAMTEALARHAGFTTGLFTSPHLVDFRERIRVNGEMISEEALARLMTKTKQVVEHWDPHPTFFELTLAIALQYYQERGVNFLVLETGLGGRLDATNAVPKDVAVLAPIGLDHQQYLGETLEEIAGEKAGIIQANKPVVSAIQEEAATSVITEVAHRLGAPLTVVSPVADPFPGLALAGHHQQENAQLALTTVRQLGILISEAEAADVFSHISWEGRFQQLSGGRMVLDGAHNPHAARVLIDTWKRCFGDEKATAVFAASSDKNIEGVLDLISPMIAEWHLVPCTSPRILEAHAMEKLVSAASSAPISIHSTLADGLKVATESGRRVLVTGSLFLLGDVLSLLQGADHRKTVQ